MSNQIAEVSPQYLVEEASNRVPAGYKQTEAGVIPLDWECHSFGNLIDYKKGYAFKSEQYGETGTRIIRVSDTSYSDIKDESPIFISYKLAKLYGAWSLRDSDLIFSTVGSKPPMYDSLVGKAIYVTKKHEGSLLNQNAVRIRAKSKTEGIQTLLLNHFRTERYIDFIEVIYRGNANQASITLENLFEFKIPLPILEKEQTAIANALSDVDALISEQEKLIAKKQAIKTATMQQLLTGRTRLPQFALRADGTPKDTKPSELGEIPEDWEVVELGSVIEKFIGGGTPSRSNGEYWGNQIPWVTVKDFATFNPYSAQESITKKGLISSASNLIPKGTLITSTRMALGKAVIYQVDVAINQDMKALICGQELSTEFLYFWFEANKNKIDELGSGSTVKGLSLPDLRKVSFLLLPKEEQTAIATILSDMDEEIQALEQRLGKTRQIKQGMMQELLTGKTRLMNA